MVAQWLMNLTRNREVAGSIPADQGHRGPTHGQKQRLITPDLTVGGTCHLLSKWGHIQG